MEFAAHVQSTNYIIKIAGIMQAMRTEYSCNNMSIYINYYFIICVET